MIDTIKIRLHGILDVKDDTLSLIHKENGISNLLVPAHQDLYKAILKTDKKNFTMQMTFNRETQTLEQIDEDEFLLMENATKLSQFYQNRNMVRFISEGSYTDKKMRINGSYRIKSSTPDVHYSINEQGSFIDFEFSIPKYLYGHNLALFVPQVKSKYYWQYGTDLFNWNTQNKLIYERLMKFIDKFFTDLMHFFKLDTCPDLNYVEIRRIDLCYNQFFDTKEDALLYLENIKKLKNEKNYSVKNKTQNFGTTYTLSNSFGSYFKVYHKGSEYSKSGGDLNKHMKINSDYLDSISDQKSQSSIQSHKDKIFIENKDLLLKIFENYAKETPLVLNEKLKFDIKTIINDVREKLPYDVIFLKNEMDKVLRYEVSLYGDFFKNLYKRKLFRKNDKVHSYFFKIYKSVKADLKSNSSDKKITKSDLKTYKMFHSYLNRSISLVLSKSRTLLKHESSSALDYSQFYESYKISNFNYKKTLLANKDIGYFSEDFLSKCFLHFKALIEKHQLKKLTAFDDLSSKIANYNQTVKHRTIEYDKENNHMRFDKYGNVIIKNGKPVLKASQLLSQTQKRKYKLKTVNANILLMLLSQIEQGISLEQYRRKANINKSTFYRYKKDLEMFGIFENSLATDKDIVADTTFQKYYWLTDSYYDQLKFFSNESHLKYN